MDTDEMHGLLGDAYDETTDEQRAAINTAAATLDAFYAGRDDEPGHTEAMATALAVILDADTLEDIGARYRAAKAAEQSALAGVRGASAAGAALGVPDLTIATRTGVARSTVLKALGKKDVRRAVTA